MVAKEEVVEKAKEVSKAAVHSEPKAVSAVVDPHESLKEAAQELGLIAVHLSQNLSYMGLSKRVAAVKASLEGLLK